MNFTIISTEVRDNCIEAIHMLEIRKPPWRVTIKEYRGTKTQEQLGYLWGCVLPTICRHIEESGGEHYTPEDVYDWFIDEYAERKAVIIAGKLKVTKRSASKMNPRHMSEFLNRIIMYAAENLHCVVPDPE